MKNTIINKIMAVSMVAMLLSLTACKKDFDKINDNPNSPKAVPTSYLLSGAEKGLMDNTWDRWWNGSVGMLLAQYYAENQYTDESQYQFRDNVTYDYWTSFYAGGANALSTASTTIDVGGLKELQQIIDLCNSDPKNAAYGYIPNQKAVAMALQAWLYQNITDTWGDVPFSEALQDTRLPQPKYDKQRDIYLGLLAKLDTANMLIDVSKTDLQGDLIYGGDMSLWKKFINSVKLRVAMRMSDREPTLAGQKVLEAVNDGVFTSNADNALFKYLGSSPNVNPLYNDRVQNGRKDFCATTTMVDLLNALSDDRVGKYYDTSANFGGYIGRPYGQNSANASSLALGDVSQQSKGTARTATAPGVYLDYAQVEFFLAEAVERGYAVGGSAEDHYKNGINASFQFWTGADAPTSYLAQAGVDYATQKSNGKTWKQIIGTQKWIALYMQGIQGWIEWRRLDFGLLQIPVDGVLDGTGIPVRMKYPYNEPSLNPKGYAGAVASQGPDQLDTKVWWDMY